MQARVPFAHLAAEKPNVAMATDSAGIRRIQDWESVGHTHGANHAAQQHGSKSSKGQVHRTPPIPRHSAFADKIAGIPRDTNNQMMKQRKLSSSPLFKRLVEGPKNGFLGDVGTRRLPVDFGTGLGLGAINVHKIPCFDQGNNREQNGPDLESVNKSAKNSVFGAVRMPYDARKSSFDFAAISRAAASPMMHVPQIAFKNSPISRRDVDRKSMRKVLDLCQQLKPDHDKKLGASRGVSSKASPLRPAPPTIIVKSSQLLREKQPIKRTFGQYKSSQLSKAPMPTQVI